MMDNPCETCGYSNKACNYKKCANWRAWFTAAWAEAVQPFRKAGTIEMNYEQMTEIINYIRAYPERFFESLEEYAISEYKPAWETLADYADWHSADFEEWRKS